jgi:protein O-mannosyl-transferase
VEPTSNGRRQLFRHQRRVIVSASFFMLMATMSVKTFMRNADWVTEESLYRSGISVNPAKGQLQRLLNSHSFNIL